MDTTRIHDEVAAGDPFVAADSEARPHACTDGYVYLGFTAHDETGDEVERIFRVPCRRCVEEDERR